jgi:glycosyltransferase involved in cell wall biosynthesis
MYQGNMMNICRIIRPPADPIAAKYMNISKTALFNELQARGCFVEQFCIRPVRTPNVYLSYGLGIVLSPLRFRNRGFDALLTDNIESAVAAVMMKWLFGIPFVFEFIDDYGLIASYSQRRLKSMRVFLLRCFESLIPRLADMVIVKGEKMKQFCLETGVPERKLKIIPDGIDLDLFRPDRRNTTLKDRLHLAGAKIVLFRGKLNRYYRVNVILEAVPVVLERFPTAKFIFVGDGDDFRNLKCLAQQLEIEGSVVFTGFVPQEQLPHYINMADVCLCSLPVSTALSLLEYGACGRPVIMPRGGTKIVGTSHELIKKDCVVLVEHSPEGFASGINFLLENANVALEMGRRAREHIVLSYGWRTIAQVYEEVLQDVLQ